MPLSPNRTVKTPDFPHMEALYLGQSGFCVLSRLAHSLTRVESTRLTEYSTSYAAAWSESMASIVSSRYSVKRSMVLSATSWYSRSVNWLCGGVGLGVKSRARGPRPRGLLTDLMV